MIKEEKFNKALVKLLELTKTGRIKWEKTKESYKGLPIFFCCYNNKILKIICTGKNYIISIVSFMGNDVYAFPEEYWNGDEKNNIQNLYEYLLEKSDYVENLIDELLKEE